MDRSVLKALILEHKENFFSERDYVPRELVSRLVDAAGKPEIFVITGIRRSGKSTLMKLVCRELLRNGIATPAQILYVNFEDERFIRFQEMDYSALLEAYYELEQPSGRKYFFLDEVQNVTGWERWLAKLYEAGDINIYVSGSNASLLSPDIATRLTGRHRQVVVWPFSFAEFLAFRKRSFTERDFYRAEGKAQLRAELNTFLLKGGFPEPLKQDDPGLLQQYYQDILYRDIAARYQVRNLRELKELALFLASNPATIHSYDSLRKVIAAKSVTTVKNYLDILENVFLFFRLQMFDYSVKRQIYNPGKFYLVDTGLYRAMAFKFSENRGHLLENLVYIELRRRAREIFYWKSLKGVEVDFVVRNGLGIQQAIQICESLSSPTIREREIRSLLVCRHELDVAECLVLSAEDDEQELVVDGIAIQVRPIWQWLLQRRAGSADNEVDSRQGKL